jgi:hypothetical protein
MNILNRYESDDFDESSDFDDLEFSEVEEVSSSKSFLARAIIMILLVTGVAYGANIALTSAGSSKIEFGQGKISTTAVCDTNGGINVTPYSGYVNASGAGKFTLDSIIFENVDANCVGKDFLVQVWTDAGADALTTSETATSGTYTPSKMVRFYFQDSATVTMMSNQYTDIELLTDVTSGEFAANQSSFQLVFDPDQISSFADATQIYKITVQSVNHTPHD